MNPASVRALLWRLVEHFEAHPSTHTTDALARRASGGRTHPTSAQAVSWCAQGMLLRLSGHDRFVTDGTATHALNLMQPVAAARGYLSVAGCNDAEGVVGVVAMARAALAELDRTHPEEVAA